MLKDAEGAGKVCDVGVTAPTTVLPATTMVRDKNYPLGTGGCLAE